MSKFLLTKFNYIASCTPPFFSNSVSMLRNLQLTSQEVGYFWLNLNSYSALHFFLLYKSQLGAIFFSYFSVDSMTHKRREPTDKTEIWKQKKRRKKRNPRTLSLFIFSGPNENAGFFPFFSFFVSFLACLFLCLLIMIWRYHAIHFWWEHAVGQIHWNTAVGSTMVKKVGAKNQKKKRWKSSGKVMNCCEKQGYHFLVVFFFLFCHRRNNYDCEW